MVILPDYRPAESGFGERSVTESTKRFEPRVIRAERFHKKTFAFAVIRRFSITIIIDAVPAHFISLRVHILVGIIAVLLFSANRANAKAVAVSVNAAD